MAPTSSIGFVLAGGGFVLLENGGLLRSNVGQWGIVLALMVALAALIGHFYQALGLYELGQLLPMALSTAVNFILLALGMFALRPDVGFVSVLTAPNLGGAMARRLFGAVIVLPPLLGFISLSIMRGLALDPAGGVGLLVTMTGLALAIAVVISAHRLEKTADALTERSRELEIARLDADGANRAKSEFLANMSHELRTPLNAVIGFSEIMREARFGPIDNRYREYSGHIHDSGNHLLAMVNQILDLAKVEAGQLTLCEETVLLQDLAARCLTVIRERSVRAGSSLVNRIPADFPAIRGDELRLRQVLLNLLSNAVKFTGRGGAITLDAQIHADDTFEITVADTGIGMNAQQLAFVFLPFQQVDTPNSRRQEGTGLGLPLARALVEQHGGTLMLESSPGIGTLARVRLPANRLLGAGPGAATSASS
jgi:signal transduction histidine kinase